MTVGNRLKTLREAADLTLEEAGKIAGTTKQSTSQIEKGVTKAPGGLFLYRWSKHYRVDLEWLITGKGDPKNGQSQAARPDAATLSAAIELGRKSLLEHDDETFDPEQDGEIVVQAYMYLLAKGQTRVTRSNVLDFAKALNRREGSDNAFERTGRARQTGKTGGSESSPGGKKKTTATTRRAG
jgi:transcriptional regulator with XRE-family HTH domain